MGGRAKHFQDPSKKSFHFPSTSRLGTPPLSLTFSSKDSWKILERFLGDYFKTQNRKRSHARPADSAMQNNLAHWDTGVLARVCSLLCCGRMVGGRHTLRSMTEDKTHGWGLGTGLESVQMTPHRTHACTHFSRCVSHFAHFIQCTCIGSRCLSDSVCLSKIIPSAHHVTPGCS